MADSRPIGPIPEGRDPDDYDRERRRVLWSLPTGLYVLGSAAGGRRNLMTLSWATQVATEPKLVAVGVEVEALTHSLVASAGAFALSLLSREDRALVRKFVKPLDDDGTPDRLAGFEVRAARTGSPVLGCAVAWLDCRVRHTLPLGSHTLFVGEIVDCGGPGGAERALLRMEDTRMSYGG